MRISVSPDPLPPKSQSAGALKKCPACSTSLTKNDLIGQRKQHMKCHNCGLVFEHHRF